MQHKIAITGLRVFAHHGVFDFERQNGQDFYIDATIWIDGDKVYRMYTKNLTIILDEQDNRVKEANN